MTCRGSQRSHAIKTLSDHVHGLSHYNPEDFTADNLKKLRATMRRLALIIGRVEEAQHNHSDE